jgi:hypothetical protein
VPNLFYEPLNAAKLQRIQSEYMCVWDEFKHCATAQCKWRTALHMMVNEHKSFAEAAAFVGYELPE